MLVAHLYPVVNKGTIVVTNGPPPQPAPTIIRSHGAPCYVVTVAAALIYCFEHSSVMPSLIFLNAIRAGAMSV